MKIKFTRDYVGYKKGAVIDVPEGVADRFIQRGNAEEVKTTRSSSSTSDSGKKSDSKS